MCKIVWHVGRWSKFHCTVIPSNELRWSRLKYFNKVPSDPIKGDVTYECPLMGTLLTRIFSQPWWPEATKRDWMMMMKALAKATNNLFCRSPRRRRRYCRHRRPLRPGTVTASRPTTAAPRWRLLGGGGGGCRVTPLPGLGWTGG